MELKAAEIEQFRNPTEYQRWFTGVKERMLLERETQHRNILLHRGIYKIIHEELFPLYSLLTLKASEWEGCDFRNCVGNQNYDVEVLGMSLKFFEISTSEFDDGEVFRRRELIQNGQVSGLARTVRDARGRVVDLERRESMRRHDDVIDERISMIRDRILSKSEKEYPANTGLLIYFDDSSVDIDNEDRQKLSDLLEVTENTWKDRFDSVLLVGPKASICVERHL